MTAAAGPLISVIVPTFNCAAVLAGALQSLAQQTWRQFEVVISDGASRDDTVQIAEQFGPRLPKIKLLSRPDLGVYDAINQGIAAAAGQWILVLGGDDRLHAADTLAQAAAVLSASHASVVYGDVRMMAASGQGVPIGGRYAGAMPLPRLMRANICQQAMFYRRVLFAQLGGFDLAYPVMADWVFNLRAAFAVPMVWIDLVVADYAASGLSSMTPDFAAEEAVRVLIRHELMQRANDRATWPLQRVLLRHADALRRQGHWRLMAAPIGSYAQLMLRRLGLALGVR
jgi:glycosyltransferase involved in cell wall biosynthesis